MATLVQALTLSAGPNAAVVSLGAAMLGLAAGAVGALLVLRRRALLCDAMAHATLPGVGLAFLAMVWAGGDGRALPGILAGAGLTAALAALAVQGLHRTRLPEDAAIGAVLASGYGLGVVVLTLIQALGVGKPAGLQSVLLGQTAGMLRADAALIGAGAALVLSALAVLRRPLLMVAFDETQARLAGIRPARADIALMALVGTVTVVGLKVTGLVLIVALLIVPGVAARFWTDRAGWMIAGAGGIGAAAAYLGAGVSAAGPNLPTGPVIVLTQFAIFLLSWALGPARGLAAGLIRRRPRREPA